jgi:hypothetical protein
MILRLPEDEMNRVLNEDLSAGYRIWLQMRNFFAPPQTFILP